MSSALRALEQLLALSEAMLAAARNGNWEALASHEARRRAVADRLPDGLGEEAPAIALEARTLIDASLRCDALIRPLVAARMKELRVLLRTTLPDR